MSKPIALLFYGLALPNGSGYAREELRCIGYGLHFWALGFGLFHVGYGWWMYHQYDRA